MLPSIDGDRDAARFGIGQEEAIGKNLHHLLAFLRVGAGLWTGLAALAIHFGRKSLRGGWYEVLVASLSILLLAFAARLLWSGLLTSAG